MLMSDNKIAAFLFNKTRLGLLRLFYSHPEESFYINQILPVLKAGSGAVQRELKMMTEAGVITRERKGNMVNYQANNNSPVFNELRNIILKINPEADSQDRISSSIISSRFRISGHQLGLFCRRNYIKKLSLFGSVLRDDFRPESDIDVLVEFEAGHVPGFNLIDMENELSRLLERKVDIRTPSDLSRYFRDKVVREARVEYEHTQS